MIKEQCISCGRDDLPLYPVEGAFMPEGHKVCFTCKAKYRGAYRDGAKLRSPQMHDLATEADRLMVQMQPERYYCMSCGGQVLFNGRGEVTAYCDTCLHRIFAEYRKHTR